MTRLSGTDPILKHMIETGLPLSRGIYLGLHYAPGETPDPWTSEHESALPEPLQDPANLD